MSKFTETEKKLLLSNRFVERITKSQIVFTSSFKIRAVKENLEGKSPLDIFQDAGIETSFLPEEFPKKSVARWRKKYLEKGTEGLKEETRGKGATGRPKKSYDSSNPKSLQNRIAYLEAENLFLKKLHALVNSKQKKSSN